MNLIKHVAIIMDGNGRWGINKRKSRNFGHKQGLKTVEKIIKESLKNNIRYLTLYAFSTENWKRPKNEIKYLFSLLDNFLSNKIKELNKEKIKFNVIGKKKFNKNLNKLLNYSEKLTAKNKRLQINLALNYGSKSEIVNSINSIKKKKLKINEKNITKNLYTRNIPDPDLLIRTGNTKRLSNFLLWQAAYSEIYFEKKLWPDFNERDYNKILNKFKKTKRNFGRI
tara:strand:- start:1849 stop:2523 length:675 start_codon:yes stop_codon:yes gene_type:complete